MLKIERRTKSFLRLKENTLAGAFITERYDLQEFIVNSPKEFFAEIGLDLFILGKEVPLTETVQDRIDILAIDQEGRAVVIELKRGNNRLQLLQAISYAGMLSKWQPADFRKLLNEERRKELTDEFLQGAEIEEINREQRIILVAEAYDYEVLVGAEWLSEKYGVDIICCRVLLAKDPQYGVEYLTCMQILPAPELAAQSIIRGPGGPRVQRWKDWDTALSVVENPAIVQYFKGEIESGQECYLPKRILFYKINGKRQFFLAARTKNAYVWQYVRFHEDIEFWKGGLSDPQSIQPVKKAACLRFFLTTEQDLKFFHRAVTRDLITVEWKEQSSEGSVSDEPPFGGETTDETRNQD